MPPRATCAAPQHPVVFMKSTTALQDPGGPIVLPTYLASQEVDYECELAVVIGRRCKNVARADALSCVLGYTAANDVSARDWQTRWGGSQMVPRQDLRHLRALGPCLVTPDEIPNPNALQIKTVLNGQVMQDWNTSDMIFDVPALIEFLSGSTTLLARHRDPDGNAARRGHGPQTARLAAAGRQHQRRVGEGRHLDQSRSSGRRPLT